MAPNDSTPEQLSVTVQTIDHVNLKIPANGIETAIAFYRDIFGFKVENLDLYESGQKSFFSIRLANENVIHFRPVEDFEPPSGNNFDHTAILIEESIDDVKDLLSSNSIDIENESNPLGATGTAPAVYVKDPFGYLLEIKETN